jgi:hypothetical protein
MITAFAIPETRNKNTTAAIGFVDSNMILFEFVLS